MIKELKSFTFERLEDFPVDEKEVLRYLKIFKSEESFNPLYSSCLKSIESVAVPRIVYTRIGFTVVDDMVNFGFVCVKSKHLSRHLKDCKEAYLFAATLGVEVDRCIDKCSKTSPSKSVVCDAIGSALIESFCDYMEKQLVKEMDSVFRFSPGYGDLDLCCQKEILEYLEASKKIGVSLTESLLMVPKKSVTAIIGIK